MKWILRAQYVWSLLGLNVKLNLWINLVWGVKMLSYLWNVPEDMSMYIMQTGCQSYFLHKLCKDKHVKNLRVSLSFRRFAPQPDLIPPTVGNINQMTETTSTLPPLQGTLVGRWSTLVCLLVSLAACKGREEPYKGTQESANNSPLISG